MKDETRARGAGSDGPGETYPDDTPGGHDGSALPAGLRFTMLPIGCLSDRRLRRQDIVTLATLASFRNAQTGACFPSHAQIAARCGYNPSTVRKALARLREYGYVDWLHFDRYGGGWGHNDYSIFYPENIDTTIDTTNDETGSATVEQGVAPQWDNRLLHSGTPVSATVAHTPAPQWDDKQTMVQTLVSDLPSDDLQITDDREKTRGRGVGKTPKKKLTQEQQQERDEEERQRQLAAFDGRYGLSSGESRHAS